MTNNYPTDEDEHDISDAEKELLRKLAELQEHKERLVAAANRRAMFWLALIITLSVALGWFLRAIFFG